MQTHADRGMPRKHDSGSTPRATDAMPRGVLRNRDRGSPDSASGFSCAEKPAARATFAATQFSDNVDTRTVEIDTNWHGSEVRHGVSSAQLTSRGSLQPCGRRGLTLLLGGSATACACACACA